MKKYLVESSHNKRNSNDTVQKQSKLAKHTKPVISQNDSQKLGPSKENITLSDVSDLSDCDNESQIPEEEKCCHCHKYYLDRNEHGLIEITQWA